MATHSTRHGAVSARSGNTRRSPPRALAVLLALTVPAVGGAQQTPVTSRRVDPEEARARALFKEGQVAFDGGEFERALRLFAVAYELRPLPGFLFNIGQCHRRLGQWEEAVFFFGRFLETSKPGAPNLAVARELKREAEARLLQLAADAPVPTRLEPAAPREPEPEPALPQPPPPATEPPLHERGWFWAVLGGAVVVVGGGIALGVVLSQPVPSTPSATTLADIDLRTR